MKQILDIPKLEGELESIIGSLITWVDDNVERKQWSNGEIDEKFAKRSTKKILEEGHTCYMNPCLDLTLVVYEVLKVNDLNPVLVIEELTHEGYPFNRLHFAIELTYEKETYFIDFITMNRVLLGKGQFKNYKDGLIESLQTIKIADEMDPEKNLFENIPTHLGRSKNFQLDLQLERLKKDNTAENYARYLSALENNNRLYLDSKI